MTLENRKRRLAPWHVFVGRIIRSVLISGLLIITTLLVGLLGYHHIAGFAWVDALLNASMILGGMGPVNPLEGTPSKLFAGTYALVSGLVLVGATGLVLGPILHRMLHKFHLDDADLADDQR